MSFFSAQGPFWKLFLFINLYLVFFAPTTWPYFQLSEFGEKWVLNSGHNPGRRLYCSHGTHMNRHLGAISSITAICLLMTLSYFLEVSRPVIPGLFKSRSILQGTNLLPEKL